MTTQAITLAGRDFLRVNDLSTDEVMNLLDYARHLKSQKHSRVPHRLFENRSMALYFEKPSNRTRVSFEVGMADFGIHPIPLRKEEIMLGVRETIADTARTLSRYVDGIVIRTFAHSDVEELARYATVPVINGLTDEHHPCQIMADLLTTMEYFNEFKGRKLVFIGDGANNMSHSLLEGCALVGMDVTICTPDDYQPLPSIVEVAKTIAQKTGSAIEVTSNINSAISGASVVYTDVWASMGKESETQARREIFADYQVNENLMKHAAPDAIVLHCLPAHRGEEIAHDTLEKYAKPIFDQAENRLHAQKAIMAALLQ